MVVSLPVVLIVLVMAVFADVVILTNPAQVLDFRPPLSPRKEPSTTLRTRNREVSKKRGNSTPCSSLVQPPMGMPPEVGAARPL